MHPLTLNCNSLGRRSKRGQLVPKRIACLRTPSPTHSNSEIAQLLAALRFKKVSPTQVLPANAYDSASLCSNLPRDHLLGPTGNRRLQHLRQHQFLTDTSTLSRANALTQLRHPPTFVVYLRYKHNNGQPASCESQERPLRRHTHPYRP